MDAVPLISLVTSAGSTLAEVANLSFQHSRSPRLPGHEIAANLDLAPT
jgi:hypothetical protein